MYYNAWRLLHNVLFSDVHGLTFFTKICPTCYFVLFFYCSNSIKLIISCIHYSFLLLLSQPPSLSLSSISPFQYVERLKSFRRPSLKVRTKSNETITTSIRSPIHSLSTTRPPFAPTQLPDPPTTPDQPLESIEPSTPSHSDDGKNRCSSGSERGQANVGPVDITSEV